MKNRELKPGDRVQISRHNTKVVTILSIGNGYVFKDSWGEEYHNIEDCPFPDTCLKGWHVDKIVKYSDTEDDKPQNNTSWPARAGDVWRTKSGTEYHVLAGYSDGLRVEHATEKHILDNLTLAQLEDMSPVLVYRMGVKL